jgi:hypothetical protein
VKVSSAANSAGGLGRFVAAIDAPTEAGSAAKRRQLEFDQGDKKLDRQDEEGQQHHDPGKQQEDDLDKILEEADIAHQG